MTIFDLHIGIGLDMEYILMSVSGQPGNTKIIWARSTIILENKKNYWKHLQISNITSLAIAILERNVNLGTLTYCVWQRIAMYTFVKTDIHQSVTTREVMEGAISQHSVSTVTKKKRMSVKIMKTFKIWERSCKKKSYRSPI